MSKWQQTGNTITNLPSEINKNERMKFIAFKTADGVSKGNISFYCRLLHVTRQGFYQYLVSKSKDCPWKYQELVDVI